MLVCVHVCVCMYTCVFFSGLRDYSTVFIKFSEEPGAQGSLMTFEHFLHQSQLSKERMLGIFHETCRETLSLLSPRCPWARETGLQGPPPLDACGSLLALASGGTMEGYQREKGRSIQISIPLSPAPAGDSLPLAITCPIWGPCCHSSFSNSLTSQV